MIINSRGNLNFGHLGTRIVGDERVSQKIIEANAVVPKMNFFLVALSILSKCFICSMYKSSLLKREQNSRIQQGTVDNNSTGARCIKQSLLKLMHKVKIFERGR